MRLTDQARLKREMQLAQSIQHTLLPKNVPESEGYEIAAEYDAAMEVGGDYYDFFEVDDNTVGMAVGDVSGKGIGGAFVMSIVRTALRLEARGEKNAAEVLLKINSSLDGEFKKGMYMTLFYIILDSKRRVINYASAGHTPMILYRGKTKGVLVARVRRTKKKVSEHPFFNMRPSKRSVEAELDGLRGGRYRDL